MSLIAHTLCVYVSEQHGHVCSLLFACMQKKSCEEAMDIRMEGELAANMVPRHHVGSNMGPGQFWTAIQDPVCILTPIGDPMGHCTSADAIEVRRVNNFMSHWNFLLEATVQPKPGNNSTRTSQKNTISSTDNNNNASCCHCYPPGVLLEEFLHKEQPCQEDPTGAGVSGEERVCSSSLCAYFYRNSAGSNPGGPIFVHSSVPSLFFTFLEF